MLEHNLTFDNKQAGFRKGRGIYDNVALLTSYIFDAFNSTETVIAVFLDIKSAYDHVDIYTLYKKIFSLNIPAEINNLIFKILSKRLHYSRNSNGTF